MVVPAGTTLTATDNKAKVGHGGLTWDARYDVVGTNALKLPLMLDGVNEKGLSYGSLNFPSACQVSGDGTAVASLMTRPPLLLRAGPVPLPEAGRSR